MADPKNESTTQQCPNFNQAFQRTVALAIDLVGATASSAPNLIERILKDKKTAEALAKALKDAGQKMMDEQAKGQMLTLDSSLSRLGAAAGGAVRATAMSEIRKQREFQRLEQGLRELGCAFERSPVGVFVNDNKTLLIIVGSVAAIAGGVAMYFTKAGDTPAELLSLLPKLDVLKIGGVTISVNGIDFQPSTQKVSGKFGASGHWGGVKADFNLDATFASETLQTAGASTRLELQLDPRLAVFAGAGLRWVRGDSPAAQATTATAEAGLRQRVSSRANLQFRLFGEFTDNQQGQSGKVGVGGGLTLDRPFGTGTRLSTSLDGSLSGPLSANRLPALGPPGANDPAAAQSQPIRPAGTVMLRLQLEW